MLVVNPNLCFDRTLAVDSFEVGTVSRPYDVKVTAGGKGVNVVRTASDLGAPAELVGLVAEGDGARLLELLTGERIVMHAVPVAGDVRSATIILELSGRATVLNEPGPAMSAVDLDHLVAEVDVRLPVAGGPLVCSGSLPPGLPVSAYGLLVELARRHDVPTIVDAARDALLGSLPFAPDLVTPNLAEAEGIVSGAVTEPVEAEAVPLDEVRKRAAAAAEGLVGRGARRAVVTAGGHGVCAAVDGATTWIPAPRVSVVNPIGAGDSFAAGVAVGLCRGLGWLEAIELGVTVASAAVEMPGAGRVDADRVTELTQAVKA
ncbi:1-phosphofructokinase family hexose kinase [Aeromicrobium sp.]|uniref:1-phosphofructokinase family hexose kinase n=1 Tax=Aeromicrobium sp. TaxID=1871063 RepID=UPI002FC75EBE